MDTNLKPRVSIQLCTYNRSNYIEDAIESVLKQTYTNWELLILDDASTDDTYQVIKKYLSDSRIKYVKNETNLGITKNRNRGLSLSLGEFIAVLDSDDYWIEETKLNKQIIYLQQNPDCVLVGTDMIKVNDKGKIIKRIIYPKNDWDIKKVFLLKNPFCHSSVLYRKKEIIEMGKYDESLFIWEDYELWLRLGIIYKLANINLFSTIHRIHRNKSNSKNKIKSINTLSKILYKYKNNYKKYYLAKIKNFFRYFL